MSRSRPGGTKQSATRIARHARRRLGILLGALAAASILIVLAAGGTPLAAQTKQEKIQGHARFRRRPADRRNADADRAGSRRSRGESRRPWDSVPPRPAAVGAGEWCGLVDLDGGFNGVCSPGRTATARSRRNASSPWKRAQSSSALSKTRRRSVRGCGMNTHLLKPMRFLMFALATVLLSAGVVSAGPAQFVIVNINAPGVGFNDPTPVACRRQYGHHAGGAAAYRVQPCGQHLERSAGQHRSDPYSRAIHAARGGDSWKCRTGCSGQQLPNAPLPGTQYHIALANKLAGATWRRPSTTSTRISPQPSTSTWDSTTTTER